MITFKQYISEAEEFANNGLTVFDIDETLFHTTAKIAVVKDGKVVRHLDNREYNTYKLQPGEEYDYSEFRSAEKFYQESKPIARMLDKAKAITNNAVNTPGSKVIIITARANFDDKERFLDTFRKHGLNIDAIRVERAGNIQDVGDVAFKKVIIIRNYLNTKQFNRVRLFDDSIANLQAFLILQREFPTIRFEAYYANPDGSVKAIQ